MDVEMLRGLERLAAVIIGGASIYLGSRLFLDIKSPRTSDGRVVLPGNISIYVSRVGPGVFFALFGTAILALSYIHPVQTSRTNTNGDESRSYSGIGSGLVADQSQDVSDSAFGASRQTVVQDVALLNQFANDIVAQSSSGGKVQVTVDDSDRALDLIDRAKTALLLSVWSPEWGKREEFTNWASNKPGYSNSAPPKGIARPAAIFKGAVQ